MTDTTRDETIEVLQALLAHPGWAILVEKARHEWLVRERNGRVAALKQQDDGMALNLLRQITAAQEAVEWVLTWPIEEVAKRRRAESPPQASPTMSRRGGL